MPNFSNILKSIESLPDAVKAVENAGEIVESVKSSEELISGISQEVLEMQNNINTLTTEFTNSTEGFQAMLAKDQIPLLPPPDLSELTDEIQQVGLQTFNTIEGLKSQVIEGIETDSPVVKVSEVIPGDNNSEADIVVRPGPEDIIDSPGVNQESVPGNTISEEMSGEETSVEQPDAIFVDGKWHNLNSKGKIEGQLREEYALEISENPEFRDYFESFFRPLTQEEQTAVNQQGGVFLKYLAEQSGVPNSEKRISEIASSEKDEDREALKLLLRIGVRAGAIVVKNIAAEMKKSHDQEERIIGGIIDDMNNGGSKFLEMLLTGKEHPDLGKDIMKYMGFTFGKK